MTPRIIGHSRTKTVAIYLGGTPHDGGTYQNALSLVSALATFPPDEYVTIGYCADDAWVRILTDHGMRAERVVPQGIMSRAIIKIVRGLPVRRSLLRRWSSRLVPLGRQLRRDGVDLCLYPNFEHFAWELDTPSLGQIHDLMHRYESQFPEVSEGRIPETRERLFSRMRTGATAVLTDSEVGKQHVIESYGPVGARLYPLPYVAPEYIYRPVDSAADASLARWAADVDLPGRYLFYPAQFWKHKNHARLLEAFARLHALHPDARLVLVGSEKNGSAEFFEQRELLGLDDVVRVLGYVSNAQMVYLYRHARGLVFPTFFGPTNIPPLEAFVLGCPVAVSGIYAMPDQLGDAALMFDPRSADEILDACLRLWEDDAECERLRARGYAKAAAWGPSQFARALLAIIDDITSEVTES